MRDIILYRDGTLIEHVPYLKYKSQVLLIPDSKFKK